LTWSASWVTTERDNERDEVEGRRKKKKKRER
jgi:hypothetical protein